MMHDLMKVFEEKSAELYSLAFLLTGNIDTSVEAFNRALEFDEADNPAFGEFMNQWAYKLVIVEALNAIRVQLRMSKQGVASEPEVETLPEAAWKPRPHIGRAEFEEAVVAIDAFPRCAMLLTVFEGMSIQQASLMLNVDRKLTLKAQRIGIIELTRNLAGDGGRNHYREPGCNPVPVLSLG